LFDLYYKIFLILIPCFLVRSSSTEHPSGGDGDLASSYPDRDHRNRTTDPFSSPNVPTMEAVTSKQRRDKMTNKAQQEEEEERGNIINNDIFSS
jgi:hypothetical protein